MLKSYVYFFLALYNNETFVSHCFVLRHAVMNNNISLQVTLCMIGMWQIKFLFEKGNMQCKKRLIKI